MWWACVPKTVTPAPGAEPVPARADGPVAGPRAIVEEPLPPPPPPDTPGSGPMNAYVLQVRKVVGGAIVSCIESGGMTLVSEAALVTATIGTGGELVALELDRVSGSEAYDACVMRAFRDATLPVPPAALTAESGSVVTPQMAFR